MALNDDKILEIISYELTNSDNAFSDSDADLEDALDLYLGNPDGNEVEGRSSVVSTDVADAIEWIMPQVMKSFTQNNEVVVFDPVHEGDEYQAELESEYVYSVLMKQNDGFILLHQFVKDALMQRNGILKVYYANYTVRKISDYTGITDEQMSVLGTTDGVEVIQHSEYIDQEMTLLKQQEIQGQIQMIMMQAQQIQDPAQLQQVQMQVQQLQAEAQKPIVLHDIKISVERKKGKIYIDPVPPEEFRVCSQHNSINLDKARFTAQVTNMTVSDVLEKYELDKNALKDVPDANEDERTQYRFTKQEGSGFDADEDSLDPSQRKVTVSECYVRMDVEEIGIARLMKVTVVGDAETPTDLIHKEEIDCPPWISTTAILMSHKFQGLSITDRLKQIQAQKTTLWRNLLDNIYLQNNQRTIVVENQVNMDDLLVSRPGGIIRAKRLDAVAPFVTPQIHGDAFNMMQYLDQVKAGRTGVEADGTAAPQRIGDRVGSEGVERLMNAKEELVGLIIRVIAETGIKPLCIKIRNNAIQHMDAIIDYKFRGKWQKIKPSAWCERDETTVRVGTGTGNNQDRTMAVREIIGLQKEMIADPTGKAAVLINHEVVFSSLNDYCKFTGLNGAGKYFLDPSSDAGKKSIADQAAASAKASQENTQMQMAMAQAQIKIANAEETKAKATAESARAKVMVERSKLEMQKMEAHYKAQFDAMKQRLEEATAISDEDQKNKELEFKYYDANQKADLKLLEIETDAQITLHKQEQQAKQGVGNESRPN